MKGEGNQQDYGLRIYDPRLGRFLSVDPLTESYPFYTPYQFAGNDVIRNIDLDGGEPKPATTGTEEGQQQTTSEIRYAPSDCNCPESDGYQVSQTWNWHSGGLGTGKLGNPNDASSEIKHKLVGIHQPTMLSCYQGQLPLKSLLRQQITMLMV